MTRPAHAASYYAASANPSPDRPALAGDVDCDVCVVGGGFTGLSTALHLAERGYSVVVLESHRIGWGASGRNGGQLGSGLRSGASAMLARFGRDHARRLWDLAEEAKATVRGRIARHAIACDYKPGVLLAAAKPRHTAWMAREVELRREHFDYPHARLVSAAEVRAMVATGRYHGGVFDAGAGHLHPLNYALGLARAAEDAGAGLFEDSPATAVESGSRAVVRTARGRVRARYVVLCCNGYLGRLERRIAGKIMPIANYMLATEPLGAERAGALVPDDIAVCDSNFVVDYFRLSADRRLLFGGGETYSGREPRDPKRFVRKYMLRVFPGLADAGIDYAWGGMLAITLNRLPQFGRLAGDVYFAHGFSGHGVALTSLAGKLIAEAIAGTAERFDLFAAISHRDFPGGTLLRKPGLVLGMLYYGLRDRL
ncbi:MAG: NAD(P)/FAD-dependent oxidoreductase [Alphaproteobacteria bacterium]